MHDGFALLLAAGSAETVSEEGVAKTRADVNHQTEMTWRQPDVWNLERKRGASSGAARL